jgi:hypothetical protein
MADNVLDAPRRTLAERLDAARRVKAAMKMQEECERKERADEIRRRVVFNVKASRKARRGHGDTLPAATEYRRHEERRERGRKRVEERLLAPELCYALPSRNLRPLHRYVQMATAMVEAGDKSPILDFFHLYHAHSGDNIWNGFEYVGRHGDTAQRVAANIVRSRIARASHGKAGGRTAGTHRVAHAQACGTPRTVRTLRAYPQAYRSHAGQRLTTNLRGRERPAPAIKEE